MDKCELCGSKHNLLDHQRMVGYIDGDVIEAPVKVCLSCKEELERELKPMLVEVQPDHF